MRTLHRIEQLLERHGHKVERAVSRPAHTADRRTRGRRRSPIDRAAGLLKRAVADGGSRSRNRRAW